LNNNKTTNFEDVKNLILNLHLDDTANITSNYLSYNNKLSIRLGIKFLTQFI